MLDILSATLLIIVLWSLVVSKSSSPNWKGNKIKGGGGARELSYPKYVVLGIVTLVLQVKKSSHMKVKYLAYGHTATSVKHTQN